MTLRIRDIFRIQFISLQYRYGYITERFTGRKRRRFDRPGPTRRIIVFVYKDARRVFHFYPYLNVISEEKSTKTYTPIDCSYITTVILSDNE